MTHRPVQVPDGCPLPPRQYEVTTLLSTGISRRQIAEQMGIDLSTVRQLIYFACLKLDVHDASQLVATVYAEGWALSHDREMQREHERRERAEEKVARLARQLADEHEFLREAIRDAVTPGQALYFACLRLDVHDASQLVATEHEFLREAIRDAVTPGQALYLASFERWLRDPNNPRRAMERALCLRAMFHESSWRSQAAGGPRILPPWEVLGRPQWGERDIRQGHFHRPLKPRRKMKVFPIRIDPR